MSKTYKLTHDELLAFAKKLYQEACCGYMDLCDQVAGKMVSDLLSEKTAIESGILAGFLQKDRQAIVTAFGATASSLTMGEALTRDNADGSFINGYYASNSSANQAMAEASGFQLRDDPVVREQVFVRQDIG